MEKDMEWFQMCIISILIKHATDVPSIDVGLTGLQFLRSSLE